MLARADKGRNNHIDMEELLYKYWQREIDGPTLKKLLLSNYKPHLNTSFTLTKRKMQEIYQRKAPLEQARHGVYPLSVALSGGNIALVKILLDAGAALRPPLEMLEALLIYAEHSRQQPWVTVRIMCNLLNNHDPNNPIIKNFLQSSKHNLLKYAICDMQSQAALAFLLEQGADIDTEDQHGKTPLLCALTKGHMELAAYLCDRGANPKEVLIKTPSGIKFWYSPIEAALGHNNGWGIFYISYTFKKQGLDCRQLLQRIFTALLLQTAIPLESEILRALLETKLIPLQEKALEPAILHALLSAKSIIFQETELLDATIEHGYFAPLHIAIARKNLATVILLIQYGADQNFYDKGEPALSFACKQDAEEIVHYLLEREDLTTATIQYTLTEPCIPEKYREMIQQKSGIFITARDLIEKHRIPLFLSDNITAFLSYLPQQAHDIENLLEMALLHQAENILTYLLQEKHIPSSILLALPIVYDKETVTPFLYALLQEYQDLVKLFAAACLKTEPKAFKAHVESCKILLSAWPDREKRARCLQQLEKIESSYASGEEKAWGHTFFKATNGARYAKEVHGIAYEDRKQVENIATTSITNLQAAEETLPPLSFQGNMLNINAIRQVEAEDFCMYAWLDTEALGTTEASLSLQKHFQESRLTISPTCLKYIHLPNTIRIAVEKEIYPVSYEFELKQHGTPARILFCQLPLDNRRGSLLVGLHFAPQGLHETNAMCSLVESALAKIITIHLPLIPSPAFSV